MAEHQDPQQAAANEPMTPAMRLLVMQSKHRTLDEKILGLQALPSQDHLLVQRLKKEKLRLKDAIERLKNELIPDLNA